MDVDFRALVRPRDDFLAVDRAEDFFADDRRRVADFFGFARWRGTLPPSSRASDNPMAIACLRLFTFLPELPLRSVPRFRSCMAFSTFS